MDLTIGSGQAIGLRVATDAILRIRANGAHAGCIEQGGDVRRHDRGGDRAGASAAQQRACLCEHRPGTHRHVLMGYAIRDLICALLLALRSGSRSRSRAHAHGRRRDGTAGTRLRRSPTRQLVVCGTAARRDVLHGLCPRLGQRDSVEAGLAITGKSAAGAAAPSPAPPALTYFDTEC